MKLTVYMATSIDGLITKGETDSNWVSKTDWKEFYSYIKSSDAVLMGRKTMEQFGGDFPLEGVLNVVLTNNKQLHKSDQNLLFTSGTPKEILDLLKAKGITKPLLIGGSDVNKQFIKADIIDEIVLSIHPLVLGNGLKVFGEDPLDIKLELVSTKSVNDELVQIVYKVIK